MARHQPNNAPQRLSSQPFIINLGQPWLLQTDELQEQTGIKSSGGYGAAIKVAGCQQQQLSLQAGDDPHMISLGIQAMQLSVHCNCAAPVATICRHAYKLLHSIAGNEDFLTGYQPGGLAEMVQQHPNLFRKNNNGYGKPWEPIPALDTVYRFRHELPFDLPPLLFEDLPAQIPPAAHDGCFIIVESYRYGSWMQDKGRMPALLSCKVNLNKAGNQVKGFHPFLSGSAKADQHLLTPNEQWLNTTGLTTWKLVEQLPDKIKNCSAGQMLLVQQLFDLWQSALPLLHAQPHVFHYRLHRLCDLKSKPSASRMMPCRVQKDRPQLQFTLQDKGAYYSLRPQLYFPGRVTGTGAVVRSFEHNNPFFVSVGNHYYLLASLRDAAVMTWIDERDQHISVFKEHFPEFEKEILEPLEKYYRVLRTG